MPYSDARLWYAVDLLMFILCFQVKVWVGENLVHYYILSRFLISRMLTVTKIPQMKVGKCRALRSKLRLHTTHRCRTPLHSYLQCLVSMATETLLATWCRQSRSHWRSRSISWTMTSWTSLRCSALACLLSLPDSPQCCLSAETCMQVLSHASW